MEYKIVGEPRGETLARLLTAGAESCDRFLVTRTDMRLNASGVDFLAAADPHLVDRRAATEYPGGKLPWGTIEVSTFRLDESSLALLLETAPSLFRWQEPELPNDLCLLRGEDPWLVTISSDRVAILDLDDTDRTRVCQAVPDLRLSLLGGRARHRRRGCGGDVPRSQAPGGPESSRA